MLLGTSSKGKVGKGIEEEEGMCDVTRWGIPSNGKGQPYKKTFVMHRSFKDTDHHASEKDIYYILGSFVCNFSCELST